jgi:hypothetical protein
MNVDADVDLAPVMAVFVVVVVDQEEVVQEDEEEVMEIVFFDDLIFVLQVCDFR